MPDASTVATTGVVLLQAPPVEASASGVVLPAHTVAVPVMVPGAGVGLTVKTTVAAAVPQLLVTV